MNMRKYIPLPLRLLAARFRMYIRYLYRGYLFRMGRPVAGQGAAGYCLSLGQPVFPTSSSVNKVHNLELAASYIRPYVFRPGEYISFWHMTGAPEAARGYLPGRNLVNGVLKEEPGGGLCQLSGLMYHLALLAGLEVVERHNHSVDIYRDEDRFTPLGADATVVYGYKNLLLRNNTDAVIRFDFEIRADRAEGYICSDKPLQARELRFVREEKAGRRIVYTYAGQQLLHTSAYHIKSPA